MANWEERLILKKCYIHGDEVFSERRIEAFITSLVKGIPNKKTFMSTRSKLSLIRAMTMDKDSTPKIWRTSRIIHMAGYESMTPWIIQEGFGVGGHELK